MLFVSKKQKREPKLPFWINLNLNYTIDSFLRRAMKPNKPKPANNMANVSGSGIADVVKTNSPALKPWPSQFT
jgi:hypothetical protein